MRDIKFSYSRTGAGRKHYLTEQDVRVVLSRLPVELWERLRAVHFNDRAWGRRTLGYVNMGHREIAICALPPQVSLTRARGAPDEFGAVRGQRWPELAVRRRLLYGTFLHELGHLQIVIPKANRVRRRFAGETRAQQFANFWRRQLWARRFDHPDPVHNSPSLTEQELMAALVRQQRGMNADTSVLVGE